MNNQSTLRFAPLCLRLLTLGLLLAAAALGQTAPPQTNPAGPAKPPQAKPASAAASALVVPTGTIIPLELKSTVNSRTAYDGEAVYCVTIFPIAIADRMLIPAGSYVQGEVTQVTKPGRVIGKAQLGLRFEEVVLPTGVTRSLSASLSSIGGARLEDAKSDKEGGDEAGDKAGNMAAQGAGDAVVDASGLGGGNPLMAASEGVGGLIVMLATRGKTIVLRPGTTMEITLREPLDLGKRRRGTESGEPPPLRHRPPAK